uniref:Cytochrome b6/f complex subunit N n=1 Tax=Chenopodium album TaxID=3559 RepID=A0A291S7V9_CHEAL|nr:cytochrome b6/f complex subunit N [Chenopodium album]
MGCFNGSLYIFSFTCSMGKKWTLKYYYLLRNKTVSLSLFYDPSQSVLKIIIQ